MKDALAKEHIVFSVDAQTPPKIEDVVKFLNNNKEDAQIVNAFQDKPQQMVLVSSPTNVPALLKMAKQLGSEYILHSKDGKHQKYDPNTDPNSEPQLGEGIQFFKNKPPSNYIEIHTVDGPIYCQHNFNSSESTKDSGINKSEDLNKAPIRYEEYSRGQQQHTKTFGLPDLANSPHYKEITKVTLPNGLEYRQYLPSTSSKIPPQRIKRTHSLYDPKTQSELAYMETKNEDDPMANNGVHPNVVHWAEVDPNSRGKGYGRQLYLATLLHGVGQLTSGAAISPEAQKAWQSFKKIPGLGGRIARYSDKPSTSIPRNESDAYEADRHHVFVKDKKQLDMNKMFPPEKLAASEDMKKSINSLDDIRQQLEAPTEEETIHIPEHTVLQWSTHRWAPR